MKTVTYFNGLFKGLKTSAFQYILVFSILFGGWSSSVFGLTNLSYSGTTCVGATLDLATVLANTNPSFIPPADLVSGSWSAIFPGSLTFSPNNTTPGAIINSGTGLAPGVCVVRWTATSGSMETYNINLNLVATNFTENVTVTLVCNQPTITHTINAGNSTGPYTDTFTAPVNATYSNLKVFPTDVHTFGGIGAPTTYTLSSVVDANGCPATPGPAIPRSTLLDPSITAYVVSPATSCATAALDVSLSNSTAGVTYDLYQNGAVMAGKTITSLGGTLNFAQIPANVTPGTYTVKGYHIGCTDTTLMSGSAKVLSPVPPFNMVCSTVGFICEGVGHTFSVANPIVGVKYELYETVSNSLKQTITPFVAVASINFNPISTAGTYNVIATSGTCLSQPSGTSIIINKRPNLYNVLGGTGCDNTGVSVILSNNELNVNYTLYNGAVAGPTNGTGNFGLQTAPGLYTIKALSTTTGCSNDMIGSASVFASPAVQTLQNFGTKCPNASIGLQNSEANVVYQVLRNGAVLPGYTFSNTTGGPMPNVYTTPGSGVYTVRATSPVGGCVTMMNGTLTIQDQPKSHIVTVNKPGYCTLPSGVEITVDTTELNVNYELYKKSALGVFTPTGIIYPGQGGATPVVKWDNLVAGSYEVWASNSGGCNVKQLEKTGPIVISLSTPPTAVIGVAGINSKCDGAAGTLGLSVVLTGNAPYTFDLYDGTTTIPITVSSLVATTSPYVYTHPVTPTASQTDYKILNLFDIKNCPSQAGTGLASLYVNKPTIAGNNSVCVGSSITLTASAGTSYLWSGLQTTQLITVIPAFTNDTARYSVDVTEHGSTCTTSKTILGNKLPIVTLDAPGNKYTYCRNDGVVTLIVSPVGINGSFLGIGVDNGGVFTPLAANVANLVNVTTPITYQFKDGFGCVSSQTKNFTVNRTPIVSISNLDPSYCSDAGLITFDVDPHQTPNPNGKITVTGNLPKPPPNDWWKDLNNGHGTLDVLGALNDVSRGNLEFVYTYADGNGCSSTIKQITTLFPDFNAGLAIQGLANTCQSDNTPQLITAIATAVLDPAGVFFSGPGVSKVGANWYFTPSVAGNGTHTITLDYVEPSTACRGQATAPVTVGVNLTMTGLKPVYCQADVPFDIYGNQSINFPLKGGKVELYYRNAPNDSILLGTDGDDADGGAFINFDPAPPQIPGSYFVIYTYTTNAGMVNECINTRTFPFQLIGDLHTSFKISPDQPSFCASETTVKLIPDHNTPMVGFFHGVGVSGTNFSPKAAFDSTGAGIKKIYYSINTGGCSEDSTINIDVKQLPNLSIDNLNATYCDFEGNTTIVGNNNSGDAFTNMSFTASDSKLITDNTGGTALLKPTNAGYGSYTVTYSAKHAISGCANSVTRNVDILLTDTIDFGSGNSLLQYWKDEPIDSLTASFVAGGFTGTGSYTASQNVAPDPVWLVDSVDGTASLDPTKALVGTHTVTYKYLNSNGCQATRTRNVEIWPRFNVTGGGNYCKSGTGLKVFLDGSQGPIGANNFSYELLKDGASFSPVKKMNGNGAPLDFGVQTLQGVYTVQVTYTLTGRKAMMKGSATISINSPDFTTSTTDVTCKDNSNGTITVTAIAEPGYWGVTTPYQYSKDGGSTWGFSNSFTLLPQGTYSIQVKDALAPTACLSVKRDVFINEPTDSLKVTITPSDSVGCNVSPYEGGAKLTITGGTPFASGKPDGYDIQWINSLNDTIGTSNIKIITGLNVGTYRYDVKDAKGCAISKSFDVFSRLPLDIVLDSNPAKHKDNSCSGLKQGEFAVKATGGSGVYEFSSDGANWFPFGGTTPILPTDTVAFTFTNLGGVAGDTSYVGRVRDYKSPRCLATVGPVLITSPLPMKFLALTKTDATCHNLSTGTITVTASGGKSGTYEYSKDPSRVINQPSNTFLTLTPDITYTISVRDPLNTSCYRDTTIHIGNPPAISAVASLVGNVDCYGKATGEVKVSVPSGGVGGFSHFWYNIDSSTVSVSLANTAKFLYKGAYLDSITDANGCYFLTDAVSVSQPDSLWAAFNPVTPASCGTDGGSATIQINGGTWPYQITWPSGNIGATESNLLAGAHGVIVKDNNLCQINPSVNIGSLPLVAAIEDVAAHKNITCFGANDGSITVIGSGGSGVYEFSIDGTNWVEESPLSPKKYTFTALVQKAFYTIQVRDKAHTSCLGAPVVTASITEPTKLDVTILHKDASCNNTNNGEITALGIGGSGVYNFTISSSVAYSSTDNWSGLIAGAIYGVWVQDANSPTCTNETRSVTIIDPPAVTFSTTTVDPTCNGIADGSITVHARNGSTPPNYRFSMDGGAFLGDSVFAGLIGGVVHSFVVQDANSLTLCTAPAQLDSLTNPPAISATFASKVNVACFGDSTGSITVNPFPLTASLEYSLDGSSSNWQTSPVFTGLIAGSYNVSVRNFGAANQCPVYDVFPLPIQIIEPAQGFKIIQGSGNDVSCPGVKDGTISITIGGGRPTAVTDSYIMYWVGPIGSGISTPPAAVALLATRTGLWKSGNYKATVTDGVGCIDTLSIPLQSPAPWSVGTAAPIPVSVSGGNDGKFTITSITGSTSPYTLRWYDNLDVLYPAGNDLWSFGNLRAGNDQYVVITGAAPTSCKDTVYFNISEPGPLMVTTPTFKDVKCFADTTGSILINITSGQPNYTFHLFGNTVHSAIVVKDITQASATKLFDNLGAGIYDIKVTDGDGQFFIYTDTIKEPEQFQLVADATKFHNITCHSGNDGSVGVKINSALPALTTNGYPLVWTLPNGTYSPPGTVGTIGSLTLLTDSGTYIAHVEDGNGCLVPDVAIKVREGDPLVVKTTFKKTVTCFGGNDGAITVEVTGRTAGTLYSYSWISDDPLFVSTNSASITDLRKGLYTLVATTPAPELCVSDSIKINITEPNEITEVNTPFDIISCNGDTTGRLHITVSGGKANYTLNIGSGVPSSGAFNITGLTAGTYKYVVTDASYCIDSVTGIVINQPAPLVVSNIQHSADCINPTSGVLTFEVNGGRDIGGKNYYNISLLRIEDNKTIFQNDSTAAGVAYLDTIDTLPMGHYKLTVTDIKSVGTAKCSPFSYSFVLENLVITGTPVDATCIGVNNGLIKDVTITGASALRTYKWTTLNGIGLDSTTLNQAGLTAGMYKLTVIDTDPTRNCTVVDSFEVKYSKELEIVGAATGLTCYDSQNGAITISSVTSSIGSLDLTWDGPSITALNRKLWVLTDLLSGDYKLDVVDNTGCIVARTFNIKPVTPITYTLSDTLRRCSPYARSIYMSSLTGGTGSGPTPAYTFTWSGPQSLLPATPNLHNLNMGGKYTVTVKDEKQCAVKKDITVSGPMKVVENSKQLACNGDSIGLIGITQTGGTGPFTYNWTSSVPGFVDPATKDLSKLKAGDYFLKVTDTGEIGTLPIGGTNCELDTVFSIAKVDSIHIAYTKSDLICAGMNEGTILLTISGGTAPYEVTWPTGCKQGAHILMQDSLAANNYLVLVEDSKGCSKSINIEITSPAPLDFTLTPTDTDCDGTNGSFLISSPTGGNLPNNYTYVWGGPSITAADQGAMAVNNLDGGIYSVRMIDLNSGGHKCYLDKSDTLTSALSISYSSQPESCQGIFDGAININVDGGSGNYSYTWSASNGGLVAPSAINDEDIGGLSAGTYNVVVTDLDPSRAAKNCSISQNIIIGRSYTLILSNSIKNIQCFGDNNGTIKTEASGGSGHFKYVWNTPMGTITGVDSIKNCIAGIYTISVTDTIYGCKVDSMVQISGPTAPLLLTVTDSTNVKCFGDTTGTIDISVTGGVKFAAAPWYKYNWGGPGTLAQNSPTQTNLLAGIYNVKVTDANGCSVSNNFIKITEPLAKLNAILDSVTNVSAFGGSNGKIATTVKGGAGTYTFIWSGKLLNNTSVNHPPLDNVSTHQTNLEAGLYKLKVTDSNSCEDSITNIFISQPGGALKDTIIITPIKPCNGNLTGVVTVNVSGGQLPYKIIWKNGVDTIASNGTSGSSSLTVGSLAAGTYEAVVKDANGTILSKFATITEPPALLFSATALPLAPPQVLCYGDKTGSIQVTVSGGMPSSALKYRLQISGSAPYVPYDQLVSAGVVTIPNLAAGQYLVKVTDDSNADGSLDQNDCSKSVIVDIIQPKASVLLSDNSSICKGDTTFIKLITSDWSFPTPLTIGLSDGTSHTFNTSPALIKVSPSATTTYTITSVSNGLGCSKGVFSGSAKVTVNALPSGNIHFNVLGKSAICLGESSKIDIDLAGKAPFTFTYKEGTNFTTVSNQNSLNYSFDATPPATTTYTLVSVTDGNNCTSVAPSTQLTGSAAITVNPIPTATIQSDTVICEGTSANLMFKVTGGTSLWTITYQATDTLGSVMVSKTVSAATGNLTLAVTPVRTTTYKLLSVKDSKGCEQSVVNQRVVVTVNPKPATLGDIVGLKTVCQGARLVSYSVPEVKNALSYVWKVPTGDTIVSGQGTTSILVNFPINAKDSLISVQASNLCNSNQSSLWVTATDLPAKPNAPTGNNFVCQGSKGLVYKVTDVPGATGYVWHLPGGFIIDSIATGSTILVHLDPSVSSSTGIISVSAVNDCGAGVPSNALNVTIKPNPTAVTDAGDFGSGICASSVNMKATALPNATYTGTWEILPGTTASIAAGSLTSPTALVSNLMQGNNKFVWHVVNNQCSATDTVVVRNNLLVVNAGGDQTVCNASATLQGSPIPPTAAPLTSGYWTIKPSGGQLFSNSTNPKAVVSNLVPNTNKLYWNVNQLGCISKDSMLIINNKPTQAIIAGSNSKAICADSVKLTGNKPASGTGTWLGLSGPVSFNDENSDTTTVYKLKKGDNLICWIISKSGCTSSDTVKVINNLIDVNAGKDTTICDQGTYLKAQALSTGQQGQWYNVGTGTVVFTDDSNPKTFVSLFTPGVNSLEWQVKSNGCFSNDIVKVISSKPEQAALKASSFSIAGTSATLNAIEVSSPSSGFWRPVSGSGIIKDTTLYNSRVDSLSGGVSVFEWRVNNRECSNAIQLTIENINLEKAEAGGRQLVCSSSTSLYATEPKVGTGQWGVKSGNGIFKNIHDPHTDVTNLDPGKNVFIWKVGFSDSNFSEDTVEIQNNEPTKADAGYPRTVCVDSVLLAGNVVVDTVMKTKWSRSSGGGDFKDDTDPNTSVTSLSQGVNKFIYTITISNKDGDCVSIDSVSITNNRPTTANAGLDVTLCTDSTELQPNTPTYGKGRWEVVKGGANIIGNYAYGIYPDTTKLRYFIDNDGGCVSNDTLVIVNNSASQAFAGDNRSVCFDSFDLAASVLPPRNKGKWTVPSGSGYVSPDTIPTAHVTGLGRPKSTFLWTVTKEQCKTEAEVVITYDFIQAKAGKDKTICSDTLELTANTPSPGQGIWGYIGGSGDVRFDMEKQPNTKVRYLDPGTNRITWSIKNGVCNSIDTLEIVNDSPTKANAGPNVAVCDTFVTLSGNNPAGADSAYWSVEIGRGHFNPGKYTPKATVANLQFGKNLFRWTIDKNACTSYDEVEVVMNSIATTVGPNQTLCSTTATLEASSPLPGDGAWTVLGGTSQAIFQNDSDPNTTVSNIGKGNNVMRWSVSYEGCTKIADVTITNDLPTIPYAGNTQELCDDSTMLDATEIPLVGGVGKGTWTVKQGSGEIKDSTIYNTSITNLSQGDNVLRWTVVNNLCKLEDYVLIKNYSPSIPNAGDGFSTCSDSITLKAATPQYGTGSWSLGSVGAGTLVNPFDPQSKVYFLKPDTNIFRWTVERGRCRLQDSIIITNNTPTKANAGPDIADCKDFATLDANDDKDVGVGKWTAISVNGNSAFRIVAPNEPKSKVEGLGFGNNILRWEISKGLCFSYDDITVFNKIPDKSNAGVDQVVCDNYTSLNSNEPKSGHGKWEVMSGLGDFENDTLFKTKVTEIGFGKNVYKWSIQYGSCSTFDLVSVVSNKAWADAGADGTTYDGTFNLAANKDDKTPGLWTVLAGQGDFADSTNFNTLVSGLISGVNTYRWSIDVDNCIAYDDVSITYFIVPVANFIYDDNDGCSPHTVKFTNYTVGRDSSFIWNFDDGSKSNARHVAHTFVNPGSYTVSLTAKGPDGVDDIHTEVVTVREHPVAKFEATPELVYLGDVVRFYNFSTGGSNYRWNFGDKATSTEQNPIYEYKTEGIYSVSLLTENVYHCTDSVTKFDYIEAKEQGFIVFPNAFTPSGTVDNGTGTVSSVNENSIFRAISQMVETYEIQVFNQWGQLIFSSTDISEGWNGQYQGQLVPQGVYVYKVTGRFTSGKEFKKVGDVMVIR